MNSKLVVVVLTAVTTSFVWWLVLQLWLKRIRRVVGDEFAQLIAMGMIERSHRRGDADLRKLVNKVQGAFKNIARVLFLTGETLNYDLDWVHIVMWDVVEWVSREISPLEVGLSSYVNVVFRESGAGAEEVG